MEKQEQSLNDAFWNRLFWASLLIATIYKIIISWRLNISFDEGYYYYWALFPQLSYFDHPPLASWGIALANELMGPSPLSVRFWALISGTAFVLIGRYLGSSMFDGKTGNIAGLLLLLGPVFMANGFIMTPDSFFVSLWAGAIVCTWKALSSSRILSYWWLGSGLCAGMGALSKYNMIIYFFALGLLFVFNPEWRKKIFFGGMLAGILSIAIFSPVLIWNYQHDWLSFRFQMARNGSDTRHSAFGNFWFFLSGLLLIITPFLALGVFNTCARKAFAADRRFRFLSAFFWAVVLFFGYFSFRARVQANWPMVAYFSGFIALAATWEAYRPAFRRVAFGLLFVGDLVVMSYLLLPAQYPLTFFGKPIDPERMREFFGGEQVATVVRDKLQETGAEFVVSQSHQMFGTLAFYNPELRDNLWSALKDRRRFPWLNEENWVGKNALLVGYREFPAEDLAQFEKVVPLGKVEIPIKANRSRGVYVYSGLNYQPYQPKTE